MIDEEGVDHSTLLVGQQDDTQQQIYFVSLSDGESNRVYNIFKIYIFETGPIMLLYNKIKMYKIRYKIKYEQYMSPPIFANT